MKLRSKSPLARVRGLTLIEAMVYIGILCIVMGFAFATFYKYWDATDGIGRNASDIARALHAGERWRADIRAASGPVEAAVRDGFQTVRIPTTGGAVVYTFTNSELRREAAGAEGGQVLSRIKSSLMQSETRGGVVVWRWELELQARKHKQDVHALFSFAAAPHGGSQ